MVMLAAILWGTGGNVAKYLYSLGPTNPQSLSFLRMALAVPALLVACLIILRKNTFAFKPSALPLMLLAGALVAAYQVAFFAAIPQVGVSIATLIALCTAPVIVAVVTAVHARRAPSRMLLLALAAAIAGTLLLVQINPAASGSNPLLGVLLALLSATLYACNALLGGRMGNQAHPLQTVLIGFAFGAVLLFVFALLSTTPVLVYPPTGWLMLVYAGVFTTGVAYALFYTGVKTTSATAASIATLMEPLTATVLAVLIFGEALSPAALIGGALLVLAMVLLLRAPSS